MKKKLIIAFISMSVTLAIVVTFVVLKNNEKSSNNNEQLPNDEIIKNIEVETEKIDNELEDIDIQIKELQEINNSDNKDEKEIEDKIKELENQKEELQNKKEEIINQDNSEKKEDIQPEISNNENADNNQNDTSKEDINNENANEGNNETDEEIVPTVTINSGNIRLEKGKSIDITVTYYPEIDDNFSRGGMTLDSSIASCTSYIDDLSRYTFTGKNVGKTTFVCSYRPKNAIETVEKSIEIEVYENKVEGISLDKSELEVPIRFQKRLVATIVPSNASIQDIVWKSSDNNIATVFKGTVTGISEGTATITATTKDGGFTASSLVKVVNVPVEGIDITTTPDLNYYKGQTLQLSYIITPYNATNKKVIWESDNENIATVNSNGLVTFYGGIDYRKVHITATTEDGQYSDLISLYCVPER